MTHLFRPLIGMPAALFALCLAGCQQDFALLDGTGRVIGRGELEITANFPSPVHLLMDGKEYAGFWSVNKIYENSLVRSRRLISDRAYAAYEAGNDPAQLKHGHASLTAGDGSEIQCDFYYRTQPGKGGCDMDGKRFQPTVQRLSSAAGRMSWG